MTVLAIAENSAPRRRLLRRIAPLLRRIATCPTNRKTTRRRTRRRPTTRSRTRGVEARDAVSGPTPHTLDARSWVASARRDLEWMRSLSPRGARTAGAQGASRGPAREPRDAAPPILPMIERRLEERVPEKYRDRLETFEDAFELRGAPATPGGGAKTRRVEDGTGGGEGGAKRRAQGRRGRAGGSSRGSHRPGRETRGAPRDGSGERRGDAATTPRRRESDDADADEK